MSALQFELEVLGQIYTVHGSVDRTDPDNHEFILHDVEGSQGLVEPATIGELQYQECEDVFETLSHPQAIQHNGRVCLFKSLEDMIYEKWSDHA